MKTTTRRNAKSVGAGKKPRSTSVKKSRYVVYSSNLEPRHLTIEQIERAVREIVAKRKLKK